ncbi:hypothetical protein AJ80_04684 [Polytolypa hystricis UAMH7299]|uniref:Coenzyme Q-binding protein COQ10 START domain-containing protein n=1 Tax=Polytolypa hystricis (strain UAMH7299) TaxID=1447883 RepID=A0A2B7Y9X6_POLH7|nr:hypothetical protein AJ80_04684 [Polytolypa hystricis UAMH7299]
MSIRSIRPGPLTRLLNMHTFQQTRPFTLPSLSQPTPRVLTASRILPFAPLPLFRTISAIDSYSKFLPFLAESTVTARDPITNYPTRAFLTVGYGPLSETFLSKVECDVEKWTVGARSGETAFKNEVRDDGGNGLFEYLDTLWRLEPLEKALAGKGVERTKVELEVRFRFRSALHATMMGAMEGQVAGMMIEAFEKRIREVEGR